MHYTQEKNVEFFYITILTLARNFSNRMHGVRFVAFIYFSLCSELYGTCSFQDVRIWNPVKNQELLRITVPNMTCNALDFAKDGKSIITGTVN